jgi:hypothetical protein
VLNRQILIVIMTIFSAATHETAGGVTEPVVDLASAMLVAFLKIAIARLRRANGVPS